MTPCGKTLGHAESCVKGHLCGQCVEIEHLEELLGKVWNIGRDHHKTFQQRVIDIMNTIREKS